MSHFFKEDLELLPPTVFNAAKKGDVDFIFKYFMQNPNGYVNSVGQNGNTMMHVAARHGQAEVISFLRSIHCPENPIDLFVKNNENKLALHLAEEYCHVQVAVQIHSFPIYGPEGSMGTISEMPPGLIMKKIEEALDSTELASKQLKETHRHNSSNIFKLEMEKRRQLQALEMEATAEIDAQISGKNWWLENGPPDEPVQGYHADGRSKKLENDRAGALVVADDDSDVMAVLQSTYFDNAADKATFMKYKLLMDVKLDELRTRFKHRELHVSHEKSITHTKVEHLEAELQQARLTIKKKEVEFQEGLNYMQDALNNARADSQAARSEQQTQKAEREEALEERAQMAQLFGKMKESVDPIKEREAKLKEEVIKLTENLKSLQSELHQKEARIELAKHLPETCKELQRKLDESSVKMAGLRETVKAQEGEIADMTKETRKKSGEIEELKENILKLRNKLGEAELEAAQDAERAREMNLEKRKEEVKAEAKEEERRALEATISGLQEIIADLEKKVHSMTSAGLEERRVLIEVQAQLKAVEEEKAALLPSVQAQLKEIEEEKARIYTIVEERMDKVAELTEELNETKVILEAEQEKVAMGAEENADQDRKIDMLRTSLQQITNHNQVVENDRQKCKDMANTKSQETSEARDDLVSLRTQHTEVLEKLTATEEELVRSGQTLFEQAKMIASGDNHIKAYAAEMSSQRALFQELSAKHAVAVSAEVALAQKLKATKSALTEAEVKMHVSEKYRPESEKFKALILDLQKQLKKKEGIEEILNFTKSEKLLLEEAAAVSARQYEVALNKERVKWEEALLEASRGAR
eukprot:CAMPEP_0198198698 /NCGR_PEP_ID=MMETSP1445-20131203/2124_1 /TAXON_ID=36898 /ORGANISM="Pyramimonas sp., Strain CCMP2087" /LENGTH=818 /DNA_ID=CAMNT_0043868327 /DNA_START=156 /DNA_END=2612 /DNA_ORIENTATION=+